MRLCLIFNNLLIRQKVSAQFEIRYNIPDSIVIALQMSAKKRCLPYKPANNIIFTCIFRIIRILSGAGYKHIAEAALIYN